MSQNVPFLSGNGCCGSSRDNSDNDSVVARNAVYVRRDLWVSGPGRLSAYDELGVGPNSIRPVLPIRGTTQAAAYDVHAFLPGGNENGPMTMTVEPLQTVRVPTGLYFAIPKDSAMLICSRSGLASRGLMVANGPGILDSDYRGELLVLLTYVAPPDREPFVIRNGDRIAQLLFVRSNALAFPTFQDVQELPAADSNRTGGFGSTGR